MDLVHLAQSPRRAHALGDPDGNEDDLVPFVHTAAQAAGLEHVRALRRQSHRQDATRPPASHALSTLLVHVLSMPLPSRTRAQLNLVAAFLHVCPVSASGVAEGQGGGGS